MRVGNNPSKFKPLEYHKPYHRIILPVYIQEGDWFDKAFETLQLSIESLSNTIHTQTGITVIANACSQKVLNYLGDLNHKGIIHKLIINYENEGKVDPVVSVMKGSREELITVSDCDVLFKSGWQQEVEKIYAVIPHVGMVSPMPVPSAWNSFTAWSWYFGLTKGTIKRENNHDFESIRLFRESIGTSNMLSEWDECPFYLRYKDITACLGSGHFCATYSRYLVEHIPMHHSSHDINNAELNYLDLPVENGGFLRLSTAKGYVYHMGNVAEDWMYSVAQKNNKLGQETLFNLQKGYLSASPILRRVITKALRNHRTKRIKTKWFGK